MAVTTEEYAFVKESLDYYFQAARIPTEGMPAEIVKAVEYSAGAAHAVQDFLNNPGKALNVFQRTMVDGWNKNYAEGYTDGLKASYKAVSAFREANELSFKKFHGAPGKTKNNAFRLTLRG